MIDFRPHKLQLITISGGGYDADGVPLPDTESTEEMHCNIVPNGRNEVIYTDGKATNFSYHIYLDQDCPTFKAGDKVRLFGLDGSELKSDKCYTVKQFFRYQLNAQLWV